MVEGYGEILDQACPNILDHGTRYHAIRLKAFIT